MRKNGFAAITARQICRFGTILSSHLRTSALLGQHLTVIWINRSVNGCWGSLKNHRLICRQWFLNGLIIHSRSSSFKTFKCESGVNLALPNNVKRFFWGTSKRSLSHTGTSMPWNGSSAVQPRSPMEAPKPAKWIFGCTHKKYLGYWND